MSDSVNRLVKAAGNGDSIAGQEMYDRFAERIRRLAGSKLNNRLSSKLDAEDIVQSVFRSFFRQDKRGGFSFDNWNSLWALLATIATRKCARKGQELSYAKRDFRRESGLSTDQLAPSEIFGKAPTNEDLVDIQDAVEWSLSGLNEMQREVVLLRLANFSTSEIGQLVGRTERTVRRIVDKFRERLERQL